MVHARVILVLEDGGFRLLKGQKNEIFGGEADTTNNRMEIMAVIMALKAINTKVK